MLRIFLSDIIPAGRDGSEEVRTRLSAEISSQLLSLRPLNARSSPPLEVEVTGVQLFTQLGRGFASPANFP